MRVGFCLVAGLQGDHEAAVRVAVVQQLAARLAEEALGTSLEYHLQTTAIDFERVRAVLCSALLP